MQIDQLTQTVTFDYCDMHFVKKNGLMRATDMVLTYAEQSDLPFICDTYQLASFLGLTHRDLHRLLRNLSTSYRPLLLKKRTGGTRRIHAPYPILSYVQHRILHGVLNGLPLSPYATAYRKHASLLSNATPHCQKKYLLKMDLENFFGSIRFEQIISAVFNTRRFPKQIGAILTALCCHEDVLPQGAPTSPALSNLVMKHFDDVMGAWCKRRGLAYTRYCDDITISGNSPLYVAYTKAHSLLTNMGFTVNDKKTHFVTCGTRQSVTGLVVNERPAVPREYRRALRQEIYYIEKYSVANAIVHGNRTDFIVDEEPQVLRYLDHLEGKIRYVMQFHHDPYWKDALNIIHKRRGEAPVYPLDYPPHFPYTSY